MLVMVLLSTLVGCGQKLEGKWVIEEGQPNAGHKIELLKDGTAISDGPKGTWKTENGRLYLTDSDTGKTEGYDYKISGATLTITEDNGTTIILKKQKK